MDESTGSAFPASCKSWLCRSCSVKNAQLCKWLIEAGLSIAIENGVRCRYLVLTFKARVGPADFQKSFNHFRTAFKRTVRFESYAATVEVKRGQPHVNLIYVGGKFIPRAKLRTLAIKAGFGPQFWITEIAVTLRDADRVSEYLTKGLRETAKWARSGGSNGFQPVRISRNWKPCGITEGRKLLVKIRNSDSDCGPFRMITTRGDRSSFTIHSVQPVDNGGNS